MEVGEEVGVEVGPGGESEVVEVVGSGGGDVLKRSRKLNPNQLLV